MSKLSTASAVGKVSMLGKFRKTSGVRRYRSEVLRTRAVSKIT